MIFVPSGYKVHVHETGHSLSTRAHDTHPALQGILCLYGTQRYNAIFRNPHSDRNISSSSSQLINLNSTLISPSYLRLEALILLAGLRTHRDLTPLPHSSSCCDAWTNGKLFHTNRTAQFPPLFSTWLNTIAQKRNLTQVIYIHSVLNLDSQPTTNQRNKQN
jgi:hypothetical protein